MTPAQPPLLAGRSTADYDRILVAPVMTSGACIAWGCIVRLLPDLRELDAVAAITTVTAVVGIIAIIITLVFGLLYSRRRSAEASAGYTLVHGFRQDLPQLNPTTGMVVRPAGEPFLTRDQRRELFGRKR